MNALRLLVAAAVVTGCNCGVRIDGSGLSRSEDRTLSKPYHRVEVSDALDVKLVDRAPEALTITTDDNLIEHITTDVTDEGALLIGVKDGEWLNARTGLVIEVSGNGVNEVGASGASHVSAGGALVCQRLALNASGASHLELDSLTGTEAVIWASGASHVSVRELAAPKGERWLSGASQLEAKGGSVDALKIDVSGGSGLTLDGVAVQSVTVNVSGASEAKLQVAKSVSGAVSGGSQVSVRGNPAERTVESSGGSEVSYAE